MGQSQNVFQFGQNLKIKKEERFGTFLEDLSQSKNSYEIEPPLAQILICTLFNLHKTFSSNTHMYSKFTGNDSILSSLNS